MRGSHERKRNQQAIIPSSYERAGRGRPDYPSSALQIYLRGWITEHPPQHPVRMQIHSREAHEIIYFSWYLSNAVKH